MNSQTAYGVQAVRLIFSLYCCLFLSLTSIYATTPIQVSGTVTDGLNGEPLPGVNISVKGGKTGTISDIDGRYTIQVSDKNAILIFTYVGFESKEEPLAGRTIMNVSLSEDIKKIDEVVVIGYGKTTKKEVTGSISTLKSENFNQGSFSDPMGLLQGKVAGLSVVNPNGGDPQAGFQVLLRGTNTLTSGQGPLIIVDGVAGADIKNVNFQEVETIDVLKDGSAAAIYGTRGTNGVLIITTKRAKTGKSVIEYSGQASVQVAPVMVKNLSAAKFRDAINTYAPSKAGSLYGAETDWFDEVTRTPFSHKHNLALSGGNEKVSHRTVLNVEQNEGILKNNDYDKFSARTNIHQSAFEGWLNLDYNAYFTMRKYTPANYDIFYQAFIHNPTEPVYDPSNELSGGYNRIDAISYYNPVAMLNEQRKTGETDDFGGNIRASLNILPISGLKWDNFLSYDKSRWEENNYRTRYYPSSIGRSGIASIDNGASYNMQYESTLNYNFSFGSNSMQALAGYTYQEFGQHTSYMSNSGFDTDDYGTNNIGVGSSLKEGKAEMSSYREMNKLISFFGRFMYNYDEKYLLSASIRREGSSRFGDNNKWGWFPAVSAGWRIKQEAFLSDADWIDDLKLRVGYGVTGNQEFANYKSLTMMGIAGKFYYNGQWINTYQPVSNPNPDLRWEKKHELNAGLDFSLLNDRLGGTVDYYIRRSKDLLYSYTVPVPPNLYNELFTNVGEISNKGIEVTLFATPVLTKNFRWNTTLTFSRNTNRLEKFTNDQFTNGSYKVGWLEGDIAVDCQRMEEGKSLGTFYGPVWLGVDEMGNDKFKNQNPDGRVPESKWEVIGNAYPDCVLGWSNYLSYKKWDLSFSLRASIGGDIMNKYRLYYENMSTIGVKNILKSQLEHPEFTGDAAYSSKYIEDGSFLKLDNLTLGYNFQFNSRYISKMRLYVSGQDIFCITGYKGLNPEVNMNGLSPGIESMTYYPRTTSLTLGVNLTF